MNGSFRWAGGSFQSAERIARDLIDGTTGIKSHMEAEAKAAQIDAVCRNRAHWSSSGSSPSDFFQSTSKPPSDNFMSMSSLLHSQAEQSRRQMEKMLQQAREDVKQFQESVEASRKRIFRLLNPELKGGD